MTAMPLRKLEEQRPPSVESGQPVAASSAPGLCSGGSPVAAMQHRLQEAVLLGFFDKPPPRRTWRGRYRALATCGVAVAAWSTVFAGVWALSR